MRWLTNFYDFRFKGTATVGIGIHPTKTWLSQLANIKIAIWHNSVLNLEKMLTQKRMECFRRLLAHPSWIEHEFFGGIRDLREAGNLWGVMRGMGGVKKSIHESWLAKGLGLGLLYWGFERVQEDIPREEASTLQIGSVAFPPGQCTNPQRHPCHRRFDKLLWFQVEMNSYSSNWNTPY